MNRSTDDAPEGASGELPADVSEALAGTIRLLGLLADPSRLRVVAALVLGAETLGEVATAASLSLPVAQRALDRLVAGGLAEPGGAAEQAGGVAERGCHTEPGGADRFRFRAEAVTQAVRRAALVLPRPDPAPKDASAEQAEVLRNFIADGRLVSMPSGRAKRLVVLDYLAGRFDPGIVYPERDVNFMLGTIYADYAALRRYLVDEGFMERRDGFYWRAGGQFNID